ncbi:MAG: hypothetical protein ACLUD2_11580 [Clostridium sp.]
MRNISSITTGNRAENKLSWGLIFPAEDIIHDVVVTMIADEKHRTKFERLPEPEAKAYFMSRLEVPPLSISSGAKAPQGVFDVGEVLKR